MKYVRAGFTLLELLLVIGIMALFITVIGFVRLGETPSARVDTGTRILMSMARQAQTRAVITGNSTRLLIQKDSDYPAFYMHYLAVTEYRSGQWIMLGQTAVLPKGVFVVPMTAFEAGSDWADSLSLFSEGGQTIRLNLDGRGMLDYLFVEFRAGGFPDTLSELDYLQADCPVELKEPVIVLSQANLTGEDERALFYHSPHLIAGIRIGSNGKVRPL